MLDQVIDRLSSGQLLALIIVFLIVTGGLIKCAVTNWRKVRVAEMEAALKQDMLNRGLSAEDINKVLSASAKKGACWPFTSQT